MILTIINALSDNMENLWFVFALGTTIINVFVLVGACFGNGITIPTIGWYEPTKRFFFYPTFFYQVYWWSAHFNLI